MIALVLVLGALAGAPAGPVVAADARALERGRALLARFECGRCHERGPIDVLPADRHCVACHRRVVPPNEMGVLEGLGIAQPAFRDGMGVPFGPPRIPGIVTHLREVPSLDVAGRLRTSWIASFLQRPHDLRRGLGETMPRLPVSADDAAAMAHALTGGREPPEDGQRGGDVARGLALLEAKGCGTCHAYSGAPRLLVARALPVDVDGAQLVRGMALAPDLRFTRARTTRGFVRALLDGAGAAPERVMPHIPLTPAARDDIVAALFDAPLGAAARARAAARLPPLDRRVTFAEVKERVLDKTCIHCHADDSLNLGVGGPGASGGFGYAGTGLVLTGYARVLAGSARPSADAPRGGARRSVFRAVAAGPLAGVPLLVAQLRARQIEEAGGEVEGVVGMPLGLPAVTAEELQLVETWVAQGRPQ